MSNHAATPPLTHTHTRTPQLPPHPGDGGPPRPARRLLGGAPHAAPALPSACAHTTPSAQPARIHALAPARPSPTPLSCTLRSPPSGSPSCGPSKPMPTSSSSKRRWARATLASPGGARARGLCGWGNGLRRARRAPALLACPCYLHWQTAIRPPPPLPCPQLRAPQGVCHRVCVPAQGVRPAARGAAARQRARRAGGCGGRGRRVSAGGGRRLEEACLLAGGGGLWYVKLRCDAAPIACKVSRLQLLLRKRQGIQQGLAGSRSGLTSRAAHGLPQLELGPGAQALTRPPAAAPRARAPALTCPAGPGGPRGAPPRPPAPRPRGSLRVKGRKGEGGKEHEAGEGIVAARQRGALRK